MMLQLKTKLNDLRKRVLKQDSSDLKEQTKTTQLEIRRAAAELKALKEAHSEIIAQHQAFVP
jgi:hypothetical protein